MLFTPLWVYRTSEFAPIGCGLLCRPTGSSAFASQMGMNMGFLGNLKEKFNAQELARVQDNLRIVIERLNELHHDTVLCVGWRLSALEAEIATNFGVPALDVFSATGPCWTARGAIMRGATRTAKNMNDSLSSRDSLVVVEAYTTVIACDLTVILYRLAALENDSRVHGGFAANARCLAFQLIADLRYCDASNASSDYVDKLMKDYLHRLGGLPWVLREAKVGNFSDVPS